LHGSRDYQHVLGKFDKHCEVNRNPSLGVIPLRLPLVLEVTIDPVLAILALLAFPPCLLFISLFSPVAHCHFLFS
jgi:hypothetical protein